MGADRTLGAEEELHLVDLDSLRLSARAPQVLAQLPPENYCAELQRTTVETNTDVVDTLGGLRDQLIDLRRGAVAAAATVGAGIAAVGTAPRSEFADFELTASGRFARMQEQYRLLVDEQLICGLQVHVGVDEPDLAVQIAQRVERDLPTLLALAASSPFWNGEDTGYASFRTILWQRWPSAGATGPLHSFAEYDELLTDLVTSGVMADRKMAYFEVRPSAHAPTLELRVCDGCPIVDDAVLIAGLFRAMVHAAEADVRAGRPPAPLAAPVHRAAIWQAARGGLAGDLLDDGLHPRPIAAAVAVRGMLGRLRPQLEALGDWDEVTGLAESVLTRGNSADRQRTAYAERGELDDVMRLVVEETHGPASGPPPVTPALQGYRVRAGDEAVGMNASARPAYRAIIEHFHRMPPQGIDDVHTERDEHLDDAELVFGVDGDTVRFDVDLLPRLIQPHEWAALSAGLVQRARAIELFLRDVYGDQRAVSDGIVSARQVRDAPGFRAEGRRIPVGVVRAPIMGFDLVRDEFGGWRVLEDNVRTPSGMAYGVAVRDMMDEVVPELRRPDGLLDAHRAYAQLRTALGSGIRPDGRIALLSSGPGNSAWFEHRTLAAGSELLLVQVDDLEAIRGRIVERATGDAIDLLYLRLDDELVDLVDAGGHRIGAEILDAAAAGSVVLASAPGNGVADDKALYRAVPDLIRYFLNEHPLLDSVPTYLTSDETERRIVLERVGDLVTKPVDGFGGAGVMIGPSATAAQVAERRAAIADAPEAWVAQEVVALSSHPTYHGSELQPRHVDLRLFALVAGTGEDDVTMADVALTRVAPEGSMVVNSSRGGGAKDTWIIAGGS